jgi:hypothetical protein
LEEGIRGITWPHFSVGWALALIDNQADLGKAIQLDNQSPATILT